ncbi:MAG: hypothetical protein JO068_00165 [Hyphomicrobiales bacterium]|nr:hypothetical protein [Hyphomicrobiales bacterium]
MRKPIEGRLAAAVLVISIALPALAAEAPPLFEPRHMLHEGRPEMGTLALEAKPVITKANALLLAAERHGKGVTCARQALNELRWRINSTTDAASARVTLERLKRALTDVASPHGGDANILPQDAEGSYGGCDGEWFLKLGDSGDELLDPRGWRGKLPPRFLDRVATPASLSAYLAKIVVSDPEAEGVDHRKELNVSTGVLSRLVLRGGVSGYFTNPEFKTAFTAFLESWQDPITGFFGEWYLDHGHLIKTSDLSVTFHMARYTKGRIGHWPELIDTLLAIKDRPYPQGWLDSDGMTNHNNYDVAELFSLGWSHMREDQRAATRIEIRRMLDWALNHSIRADGEITPTAAAEPLGDMYYFAAAFLDTIGYFDERKRFWTDEDFPQAERLRMALEAKVRLMAADAPFTGATLSRLTAPEAHENVTLAPVPGTLARLSATVVLPISGKMDAHPSAVSHDSADLRVGGMDRVRAEEPFP